MKETETEAELTGRKRKKFRGRMMLGRLVERIIARVRGRQGTEARMALVERITLGPRQNLALVEADGRRFLVATSAEGGPAFLALDGQRRTSMAGQSRVGVRVSW
jgi:Flagellar biosynthesis protein, FliO